MTDPDDSWSNTAAMAAIPDANATAAPPSSPPTICSRASHVGVPSSRAYARRPPSTKFEAGTSGTFSGEPGRRSRPADTSHDSTAPDFTHGAYPNVACDVRYRATFRAKRGSPVRLEQM